MKKISKEKQEKIKIRYLNLKKEKAITLISLVITIVLNSSYLAMDRINKIEKI